MPLERPASSVPACSVPACEPLAVRLVEARRLHGEEAAWRSGACGVGRYSIDRQAGNSRGPFPRASRRLGHTVAAARWMTARQVLAVLSQRVAMRRYSLSVRKFSPVAGMTAG